jgi:hypothetical protein
MPGGLTERGRSEHKRDSPPLAQTVPASRTAIVSFASHVGNAAPHIVGPDARAVTTESARSKQFDRALSVFLARTAVRL